MQKKNIISLLLVFLLMLAAPNICSAKKCNYRNKKAPSCSTLRAMARIYMAYGEYTKARPLAERALNMAEAQNAPDGELCMCYIDLAWLFAKQGKFNQAEQACLKGLQLQKKAFTDKHPYVAYTLRNLSSIYLNQGKYEQAMSVLDQAIAIMLEYHLPEDPILAPFKVDIAKVLVEQGKLREAENCYRDALEMLDKSYGPDHLYTAGVYGELARLYTLQKKYSQAEVLINKAITAQEKVYGPDHHFVAPAMLTMADIYQAKGRYSQAEQLINRALTAVEKTGNETKLAEMQKRASEIRTTRQVVYGPVAKADMDIK